MAQVYASRKHISDLSTAFKPELMSTLKFLCHCYDKAYKNLILFDELLRK